MDSKCEGLIRHLSILLHLDGCLGFIVIVAIFNGLFLVHDLFVLTPIHHHSRHPHRMLSCRSVFTTRLSLLL